MSDLIDRQAAIYLLEHEIELSNRALDFAELVGTEREKFSWGLGLLESIAEDIKQLPSAEPDSYGHYPKMKQLEPPADPEMSQAAREIAQAIINERTMRESLKPQWWIPVTERLPNSSETVIVSVCDETGDTRFDYSAHGWVTTDKEYWIVDDEINNYVVAWMPLPEPYKRGAE